MSYTIQHSVGRRGTNEPDDVRTVQTLLRLAAQDPGERNLDPRREDGTCDDRTIRSITIFQERFMERTDGLVEAGGRTFGNLVKVTTPGACMPRSGTLLAADLVKVLLPQAGQKYVLGAVVPKENANWIGPWDCAEFVAWGIYQVAGRYVGCRSSRAPNRVTYMNGYTGYFAQDLPSCATAVTQDEAAEIPGIIALRVAGGPGQIGHIAVTRGGNQTIEAAGRREGVRSKRLRGRGWHSYWRLDFLEYATDQCSFV